MAVTTNGYDPGGVACPPGDFGKLLHADIPTAIRISTPNESANRGRRLIVHIAPQSDMLASNIANPPAKPPGNGLNPGTAPLQNVCTTIATLTAVPVNTIELGTMLHVMSCDELVHPSCTVPVVPAVPVSVKPNTALLPGEVTTVEGLPGATVIITGELLLNVAVTVTAALTVTVHVPVPGHPATPLQPAKVDPFAGVAVSVTTWPLAKLAEHVAAGGQTIPAGLLVTVPVPVPASFTAKVKLFVP